MGPEYISGPSTLNSHCSVSNLPFLGKVIEKAVGHPLQTVLEEMDYLDLFLLGFRPGYSMETVLVDHLAVISGGARMGMVPILEKFLISQWLLIPMTTVSWNDSGASEWEAPIVSHFLSQSLVSVVLMGEERL